MIDRVHFEFSLAVPDMVGETPIMGTPTVGIPSMAITPAGVSTSQRNFEMRPVDTNTFF